MENSYNNRDFERFVKQNADQYRMFPSEKVWKGIHGALHTRRRWYGIGLALLLVSTATVTAVMLIPGNKNGNLASAGKVNNTVNATPITKAPAPVVVITNPENSRKTALNNYPSSLPEHFAGTEGTSQPDEIGQSDMAFTQPVDEPVIQSPALRQAEPVRKSILAPNGFTRDNKPAAVTMMTAPLIKPVESFVLTETKIAAAAPAEEKRAVKADLYPPFTIESVVNSYIHSQGKKKWEWQLYFTPTISYRSLTENTEFISAARYNSIVNGTGGGTNPVYYSTDVNSVVNHKPDLGFQLGARASYPLSKWFSLTAGFQFGVSKYDIKAYDHSAEVATIALTARNAYGSNTVSTVTNYRNGNGYRENWLRNFYFSASVPVGMELKLSDDSRNYFGIAGTLQPTYVLDNRAYLISTDYKNYAEVPSLTRRFNMNTSFEIFTAHTTGKLQWRVGPQVHYQLMSSFVKNYPIKEHLFDFGLKLGVTLK